MTTIPALDAVSQVAAYHDRTKHHLDRYAASLGRMDWTTKPEPFRTWRGCERVPLPRPEAGLSPTYDRIVTGNVRASATMTRGTLGTLLYHALALSAWKETSQRERWALRVNPSSGNLHPTEAYVLCGALPGLEAGLYHYAPEDHALERRVPRDLPMSWQAPGGGIVIVLSSILWREVWKYGERAFRYCQHDIGHAVAAIDVSAAMLGWRVVPLTSLDHTTLAACAGLTDRDHEPEGEYPELALAIAPVLPDQPTFVLPPWARPTHASSLIGSPNRLSPNHHAWPVVVEVERATRALPPSDWCSTVASPQTNTVPSTDRGLNAQTLVRQRRSAMAMDGNTSLTRDEFLLMLERTLPAYTTRPFSALAFDPQVALLLFVHRVDDCEPGLYLLGRAAGHLDDLHAASTTANDWSRPAWAPAHLDLVHLADGDARQTAKTICCHQDIAADGAFAVAMLARFQPVLSAGGPGMYRRLFWECGAIGQVLYLEAEAASPPDRLMRATGIGCFFDDEVHALLGFTDQRWQSLYHFTVGGPVGDTRLVTAPAYDG